MRAPLIGLSLWVGFLLGAWAVPPTAEPPRLEPVKEVTPTPQPSGSPKLRFKAEAHAPERSIIKPIGIDVFVTNYASYATDDIQVVVHCTPEKLSAGQRPYPPGGDPNSPHEPGLLDPFELDGRIETLYAGRTRKLSFVTPYYATAGFRNDHGYFIVENLVPNLRRSVLVKYKVVLQVEGRPLSQNIFPWPRNFFLSGGCHLVEQTTRM